MLLKSRFRNSRSGASGEELPMRRMKLGLLIVAVGLCLLFFNIYATVKFGWSEERVTVLLNWCGITIGLGLCLASKHGRDSAVSAFVMALLSLWSVVELRFDVAYPLGGFALVFLGLFLSALGEANGDEQIPRYLFLAGSLPVVGFLMPLLLSILWKVAGLPTPAPIRIGGWIVVGLLCGLGYLLAAILRACSLTESPISEVPTLN